MALGNVASGSRERLTVTIVDRSGGVTDLSAAGPKFDVIDFNDNYKYGDGTYANGQAATASGMVITAEVDAASGGNWTTGDYRFFVWFQIGTEKVRKGPFEFAVVE